MSRALRLLVTGSLAAAVAALFSAAWVWRPQPAEADIPMSAPAPLIEDVPDQPADPTEPIAQPGKHWARRVAGWVVYVAIVAVVVIAGPRVMAQALGTDYPMAAVTSGSMWPTLHKGDMVILRGVDSPADLSVGDIVGFRQADGGFTIHRVVKLDGNQVTTKGDANPANDDPIDFSAVVGKAAKIDGHLLKVRDLGYFGILIHGITHNAGDSAAVQDPGFSSHTVQSAAAP